MSYHTAEIIAQLDRSVPLQLAHIRNMERLEREGCRYANEDCDVRMSARGAVGRTVVAPYEAGFVAKWGQ
jgi:hypothetical protein